jgi:hypothetical protein
MRCDARDALREPMRCELVAVACADTGTASWLQLHAQIQTPCFLAMLKTKGFIESKGSKRDF